MQAQLIDFFDQQEWPDAELHVHLAGSSAEHDCIVADGGDACATVLELPVHRILLSRSEVFKAQLLRWGKKRSRDLPEVDFTVTTEEHLTGLLASLSVLYGNEELFRQVPQQDLVSAVLYGDQLAIPRAVELGMQLLKEAAAAEGAGGLAQECCRALAAVPHWPACMLPLASAVAAQVNPQCAAEQQQVYQGVLVAALGDLEAVWGDQQLQEVLLALPLPAAELLLSSDQLRVVSEDTVLYTAVRYMEHLDSIQGRQAAKEALAKCLRCVQLSNYCLLGQATTDNSPLFDEEQQRFLLGVFSLRQTSMRHCLAEMKNSKTAARMPKAWLLPARAHLVPPSTMTVTGRVAVAEIRAACRKAASSRRLQFLRVPGITGPMYATDFALELSARWMDPGVTVGLSVVALHWYGPYLSTNITVACSTTSFKSQLHSFRSTSHMWQEFLGVGTMVGGDGWDEAAWVAKGLPLEGHIELQLKVEPL